VSRLQGFEKRLSGLVNGAVAKVFRGQVQPVEIAQALTDEAEARKVVGASRTLVPNRFVVDLGSSDHARLQPYADVLGDELADIVTEHAREARWSFVGPVSVTLAEDSSLDAGVFRVRADVDGHVEAAIAPPPEAAPVPTPPLSPIPSSPTPSIPVPPSPLIKPTEPPPMPVIEAAPARLEISDGRVVDLTARVTRMGRAADVDIRIDDTAVSRVHAELRRQADGRHLLADLDSTNGTQVNGSKVSLHWLVPGDRIELGGTTLCYLTG
jgi:hypothetical protein